MHTSNLIPILSFILILSACATSTKVLPPDTLPPLCEHALCNQVAKSKTWPNLPPIKGTSIQLGHHIFEIPDQCSINTIVPDSMHQINCEKSEWMLQLITPERIEPPQISGLINASGYTLSDLPRFVFTQTPAPTSSAKPATLWFERNAMILKRGWFDAEGDIWFSQLNNQTLYVCNNCNMLLRVLLTDSRFPNEYIEALASGSGKQDLLSTLSNKR